MIPGGLVGGTASEDFPSSAVGIPVVSGRMIHLRVHPRMDADYEPSEHSASLIRDICHDLGSWA